MVRHSLQRILPRFRPALSSPARFRPCLTLFYDIMSTFIRQTSTRVRQYKIKVIRAQKHYNRQTGIKDIKRERSKS